MRRLFVLLNHPILPEQKRELVDKWGVDAFINLSDEQWKNIPADVDSILPWIEGYMSAMKNEATQGDLLLVQGDFGATYALVRFARTMGMVPLYATTQRQSRETVENGQIKTERIFVHVRFREYEEIK